MARPQKKRYVCKNPICQRFSSNLSTNDYVNLKVDEYETIRLIDLEGLSQEECAEQMQVGRTTIQAIYENARYIIADAIVNNKNIIIKGGDYELCSNYSTRCGRGFSKKCHLSNNVQGLSNLKEINMKIAVTYENGLVFQHFGHTEAFKIYEVENKKVIASSVVSCEGFSHGTIANFLKNQNVQILICGGIGGGAQVALSDVGIEFYPGIQGSADEAVQNLLDGKLVFNPNVKCNHHEHDDEEHHHCGNKCCH